MIGTGNDKQVERYLSFVTTVLSINESAPQFNLLATKILKRPELATDPKFNTNASRVANRAELVQLITDTLMQRERDYWLKEFTGIG